VSRNQDILTGLLTADRENRLHHAYILSGPASVAKVDCVERFAAKIFSESGGGLFAGGGATGATEEQVLHRIHAGHHPDFTRLEDLEKNKELERDEKSALDQVRELPRLLAFPPLEARRRVVLIPGAADLNTVAFNSILKVLEEPPAHTMFFLLCRDPADLLRTIVSRCQVLRFAPLSDEEMLASLGERVGGNQEAVLGWSEGSMERAELLLTEENALALRKDACDRLLELWEASPRVPSSAARWVEKVEGETATQLVLDSWETLLRDFTFVASGAGPAHLRFRDCHIRLAELARKGGVAAQEEIPERSSAINRFRVYRRLNGNLRLDFSALLTELQIFSIGKSGPAA